jgi:anti-sigma regulatory factor (Ser/Thr protein kinase)
LQAIADFPPELTSPRQARRWLAEQFGPLAPAEHGIRTAQLLVSEVATNCVVHARTSFTIGARLEGHVLRVEVADGSGDPPVVAPPERVDRFDGRGLRIVAETASAWGWRRTPNGKVVWFELPLTAGHP